MPYKRVGIKKWVHNFIHLPIIEEVWVNGAKNTEWKYCRFTGELKFKQPIPKGALIVVISHGKKPRKRGKKDDSSGTEQTVLHTKAD